MVNKHRKTPNVAKALSVTPANKTPSVTPMNIRNIIIITFIISTSSFILPKIIPYEFLKSIDVYIFLIMAISVVIFSIISKPDTNVQRFDIITRTVEVILLIFGGYILWREFIMNLDDGGSIINTIASILKL